MVAEAEEAELDEFTSEIKSIIDLLDLQIQYVRYEFIFSKLYQNNTLNTFYHKFHRVKYHSNIKLKKVIQISS